MKFLDAKNQPKAEGEQTGDASKGRIATKDAVDETRRRAAATRENENKMLSGSRPDQTGNDKAINASDDVVAQAKLAGVDLSTVSGTGPNGEITSQDVTNAKKTAKK